MYAAIIIVLIALGAFVAQRGIRRRNTPTALLGGLLVLGTIGAFSLLSFWGEMLWFDALGYADRFWDEVAARAGLGAAGLILGWCWVWLPLAFAPAGRTATRAIARALGAFLGLLWGLENWDRLLLYMHRVTTDVQDPILHADTAFYLFSLPLYDTLYGLLLLLSIIGLIAAALVTVSIRSARSASGDFDLRAGFSDTDSITHVYVAAGLLGLVLVLGRYLARFELMHSTLGTVAGAGWTDVHVRLPGYAVVMVVLAAVSVALLMPGIRKRLASRVLEGGTLAGRADLYLLGGSALAVAAVWILALGVVPGLLQWLRVEPNEITYEKPYIEHNIRMTRKAYGLDAIEEREFPAEEQLGWDAVNRNAGLFENIRLWDWRALDAVYQQFQGIRLYYEFQDVDIDRYRIGGKRRQVMVSARELNQQNLPDQSQTFVNRRFKYTHGYGITLTTVNDFTSQGLPNLLIRDIPPKSSDPSLEVTRPEIYYGELTRSHVVVNSQEKEFDYPSGDRNVYARYSGEGGVALSNLWRKFVYGWVFDGTRFLLSSYPTRDSRIMFRRNVRDRVSALAPFLNLDEDPYMVLEEGKLYWILDGYTTSDAYPYSEPYPMPSAFQKTVPDRRRYGLRGRRVMPGRVNYIRNSVKAVVDAYSGRVTFYVFDPDDALIRTWSRVFPGMFRPRSAMPEGLERHVRYPADMLLLQGLVYAKYHMTAPTVFYNQEDLWVRATEKYYNNIQYVEPYYILWQPPGASGLEYVLMLPFTPKKRQVLIGWMAGMCDPGNYGRLLAYKFPKEKRILGPQQVETKIDQDAYLSGQLTLWDQRGSNVIRGNVLAIPVEQTLLYVEPIYLEAETAAYPELRLVVLMHNDNLSYAETFEAALEGLIEGRRPEVREGPEQARAETKEPDRALIRKASEAFQNYLDATAARRFEDAADALSDLETALSRLQDRSVVPTGSER